MSARGELYCWGFSAHGQTGGVGYYEEARPTPTLVSGFPEGSKVVSVAAGLLHTCAIVSMPGDEDPSDGDVYCFGTSQNKQLACQLFILACAKTIDVPVTGIFVARHTYDGARV